MTELVVTAPGGTLKTLTISATAGNVVTNLSPGAGKRWVLMYGRLTLVADANAANRVITAQITDDTNILLNLTKSIAITASQTHDASFARRIGVISSSAIGTAKGDESHHELPEGPIEGSDQFRITITAGLAGDSYSGFFRVLEVPI